MLTSYADDDAVYAAIVAGADGYLLKQTRGREVVSAIEAVARGESLLDPAVTATVLARMRDMAAGKHHDKLADLSEQERHILGLIAEGKTNREIAGIVYLSEKTVKNYVSTILSKLGMERRAQAAAFLADQRARGHE
jgi:DNA-binding NarL/FixJ family response regulator